MMFIYTIFFDGNLWKHAEQHFVENIFKRRNCSKRQKEVSKFIKKSCIYKKLLFIFTSVFHWPFLITYIFSVSLKFEARYITGQWGRVQSKERYFIFTYTFGIFLLFFIKKLCFYHVHFFF